MKKEMMKAEPDHVAVNTGEIVEVHPTTEQIVAKVNSFLDSKEKKVYFNGKRYAEYDDYQYIASLYEITVKTFDPRFIEINGKKGFHAKALLVRDQFEVGRAEAFCMDDEPNWRNKPLFQLASMAQTRAASKAFSNLFRHIVRMAGLEGTPAEEMDNEDRKALPPKHEKSEEEIEALGRRFSRPPVESPASPPATVIDEGDEFMSEETAARPGADELQYIKDEIPFPDPPPAPNVKPISEKQRGLIWVKCKKANLPEKALKAHMKKQWNVDHTSQLPWQAMEPLLKWIASFEKLDS